MQNYKYNESLVLTGMKKKIERMTNFEFRANLGEKYLNNQ